jgi:hypothetical protein
MRTLVSAVSIGLVAVSGMAYSLQATRPAASSSSHAPEAATMPDEHVGISVLQTDTFQDPAPPDSVGPKISRVEDKATASQNRIQKAEWSGEQEG